MLGAQFDVEIGAVLNSAEKSALYRLQCAKDDIAKGLMQFQSTKYI